MQELEVLLRFLGIGVVQMLPGMFSQKAMPSRCNTTADVAMALLE